MQIEHLERDGRALRVQLSEKLTEIKTQLQEERKQLNEQTQNEFHEARKKSQKDALRVVLEKVEEAHHENNQVREKIVNMLEQIKALEHQKKNLLAETEELKRNELYEEDVNYLEVRRLTKLKEADEEIRAASEQKTLLPNMTG
ncbi:hypothetical protein P879_03560 [Paragonimus westermani]|uniref:Uncharacterized protein n=1 Tax=Paragonimus westermani TaxID=34504 RepID=A0A8T0DWI1_9TREM|nr:hypothetical protein P879_03560 [Paragonimus westermani]